MAFDYYQTQNGSMRVKRGPRDIDMKVSIRLHGIKKTLMDQFNKSENCFLIHGGFTI